MSIQHNLKKLSRNVICFECHRVIPNGCHVSFSRLGSHFMYPKSETHCFCLPCQIKKIDEEICVFKKAIANKIVGTETKKAYAKEIAVLLNYKDKILKHQKDFVVMRMM